MVKSLDCPGQPWTVGNYDSLIAKISQVSSFWAAIFISYSIDDPLPVVASCTQLKPVSSSVADLGGSSPLLPRKQWKTGVVGCGQLTTTIKKNPPFGLLDPPL